MAFCCAQITDPADLPTYPAPPSAPVSAPYLPTSTPLDVGNVYPYPAGASNPALLPTEDCVLQVLGSAALYAVEIYHMSYKLSSVQMAFHWPPRVHL